MASNLARLVLTSRGVLLVHGQRIEFLQRTASLSPVLASSSASSWRSSQQQQRGLFSTTTAKSVPVELIKIVRQRTSAGMMDCRNALAENNNDVEAAIQFLVKKGQSGAYAKKDKTAAEGAVYSATNRHFGAVVELNSETDFVSRGEQFQALAQTLPKAALSIFEHGKDELLNVNGLLSSKWASPSLDGGQEKTVEELISLLRFQLGENILLRRASWMKLPDPSTGVISDYTHGKGKYAALVALRASSPLSDNARTTVQEFGKRLAVQLVGYPPQFISRDQITANQLKELSGFAEGTPEAEKWIQENVFLESELQMVEPISSVPIRVQHSGSVTIAQALQELAKAIGVDSLKLEQSLRWKIGEGVEKKAQDFAAEVAAATSS